MQILMMGINAGAKGELAKLLATSYPMRKQRGTIMEVEAPEIAVENGTVSGSITVEATGRQVRRRSFINTQPMPL